MKSMFVVNWKSKEFLLFVRAHIRYIVVCLGEELT